MDKLLFEELVNSSVDGIFAFDKNCYFTAWNPAMERFFGVGQASVLGNYAFDLFPFLKETGEDKFFFEALAGQTIIAEDRAYMVPETDRIGYYEGHYSPLLDQQGQVSGGVAILRDVTRHKHQIEIMQRDKVRNQALLEAIPDLVLRMRKDGTYLDVKPADSLESMVPPAEFLGKSEYEVMPAAVAHERMRYVERALQTGEIETFEYKLLRHSDMRHEEARIVASGEDEVVVIVRDITERKRIEAAITHSNRQLLTLQYAGAAITSSLNLQNVLDTVSREMVTLLQITACAISEWDQTANTISMLAEYSSESRWKEGFLQKTVSLEDLPLAKQILTKRRAEQITASQLDIDPADRAYMQKAQIKTLLMLPMEFRDCIVGLVQVMDDHLECTFTYEEVGLAQMLVNQAAIAVENARLYEQAQQEIAERRRTETELNSCRNRLETLTSKETST